MSLHTLDYEHSPSLSYLTPPMWFCKGSQANSQSIRAREELPGSLGNACGQCDLGGAPTLTSWCLTVKQNNFTLQRMMLFEGVVVTV